MNGNSKVCLCLNFIAPYYLSVLEHLQALVGELQDFVSTPMEANRSWHPQWGSLSVTVQKCWTYTTSWRHEQGFSDKIWRHIPYDTLALLIRHRPDVVISAQLGFRTLQAACYRKLFPTSRLIIWLGLSEHTEKGLPKWRALERKALLAMADAILVNGKSGTNYLLGLGVPSAKIFPLPYCAEIVRHLQVPLERGSNTTRRLLSIGQLTARKGLVPFLIILSNWLRKNPNAAYEFWVAGDGPMRGELETLPVPSQLNLHLIGSVAYEKLPQLYAQGGLFVFPTLADEWGVVVNEAMAAGLPVLGSLYSQAVAELVQDGVTGWTFHPDQPQEIYSSLDRALTVNDEQIDHMRLAAREHIRFLTPQYGAKCYAAAIDFVRSMQNEGSLPPNMAPTDSDPMAGVQAPTS